MKSNVTFNRKTQLNFLMVVVLVLASSLPVHASYYTGGDWGGSDLLLLDGDSLSGYFSNVGQLYIPAGAAVTGSADNLAISAGNVLINGSLNGIPSPGYDLTVSSLTDITLNGSLGTWKNIFLSANSIAITGTIALIDGTSNTPPHYGEIVPIISPIIIKGGSLALVPTPLPAAFWLLGSGLLGLLGIRRKQL